MSVIILMMAPFYSSVPVSCYSMTVSHSAQYLNPKQVIGVQSSLIFFLITVLSKCLPEKQPMTVQLYIDIPPVPYMTMNYIKDKKGEIE